MTNVRKSIYEKVLSKWQNEWDSMEYGRITREYFPPHKQKGWNREVHQYAVTQCSCSQVTDRSKARCTSTNYERKIAANVGK